MYLPHQLGRIPTDLVAWSRLSCLSGCVKCWLFCVHYHCSSPFYTLFLCLLP